MIALTVVTVNVSAAANWFSLKTTFRKFNDQPRTEREAIATGIQDFLYSSPKENWVALYGFIMQNQRAKILKMLVQEVSTLW